MSAPFRFIHLIIPSAYACRQATDCHVPVTNCNNSDILTTYPLNLVQTGDSRFYPLQSNIRPHIIYEKVRSTIKGGGHYGSIYLH